MLHSQNRCIIDSDEEDYELPILSQRIKTSFKPLHTLQHNRTFVSENEESEFLKFSKSIHDTPCSKTKLQHNKMSDSDNEESDFLKFSASIRETPCSKIKLQHNKTSDSDNEESDFLKFSASIRETPCSKIKLQHNKTSDSDNEESDFLEFSASIRETPCSKIKLQYNKTSDCDNEESEFLKFPESICKTPCSKVKYKLILSSDSENEESEFLKFSERIRNTPQSQHRLKHNQVSKDSERDGVFSNFKKVQEIQISKSDKRHAKESNFLFPPRVPEKQKISNLADVSNKENLKSSNSSVSQTTNEKEYVSLFPAKSDDSMFHKNRQFYTQALFEFFNRKIFNTQLPQDMPLIWDAALVKTAGLTICKVQSCVYTCSIKLSSKLLNSFDRLQDTLLHEMCHAAVWMINKKNVRHGPLWQIWASRCKMVLPFVECPSRCHNYDVPYRVWYQCTGCQWKRGACRQIKKYQGAMCKRCKVPIIMTTVD